MKRILYISILALVLGGITSSCVDEDVIGGGNNGGLGAGGEGDFAVSFTLCVDDITSRTRAGETHMNLAQESEVKTVRIILYNEAGKAAYINDFSISEAGQWHTINHPFYQTKAIRLDAGDYEAAVLVNYDDANPAIGIGMQWEWSIQMRTAPFDHDKSMLTDIPIDPSFSLKYGTSNRALMLLALMRGLDTAPSLVSKDYIRNHFRFFMSNADGLLKVTEDRLSLTPEDAEAAPIELNVERAVAKVAFLRRPTVDISFLPDNARITEKSWFMSLITDHTIPENNLDTIRWRTDKLNMQVYPIRKQAPIAPVPHTSGAAGKQPETLDTNPRDRYAEVSSFNDPVAPLFKIPGDTLDRFYLGSQEHRPVPNAPLPPFIGLPLRVGVDYGSDTEVDLDSDTYDHFEYVTENTFGYSSESDVADNDQKTEVLVRVPIMAYYKMATRIASSVGGAHSSYSGMIKDYVVYDNVLYPLSELAILLGDTAIPSRWSGPLGDARIPYCCTEDYDFTHPPTPAERIPIGPLEAYINGRSDAEKQTFKDNIKFTVTLDNEVEVTAKEAKTIAGIAFYKDGLNYYRVPIRHFSDEQIRQGADHYGYYGVVRNNTYVLFLRSISGYGSPSVIPPGDGTRSRSSSAGRKEKGNSGLEVEFRTTSWHDVPSVIH